MYVYMCSHIVLNIYTYIYVYVYLYMYIQFSAPHKPSHHNVCCVMSTPFIYGCMQRCLTVTGICSSTFIFDMPSCALSSVVFYVFLCLALYFYIYNITLLV